MTDRRYWWVNHSQTAKHEIEGGYLWSPKKEAHGARSQFYENMREATPRDFVLSYSEGTIKYIGIVTDFSFTSLKPGEFGNTGSYWNQEGWMLPVSWTKTSEPFSPKLFLSDIRDLLPKKYSPLNPNSGHGNQKAYLSEISSDLFHFLSNKATWPVEDTPIIPLRDNLQNALDEFEQSVVENDISLDNTTKRQVILARRGQGKFRKNVAAVEKCCRVTGIQNPALLIASHIKPWSLCSSSRERLSKFNGLMLTPHIDHLFDMGFISFSDDGTLLISAKFPKDDQKRILFEYQVPRVAFCDEQLPFIRYHRENVLLAGPYFLSDKLTEENVVKFTESH